MSVETSQFIVCDICKLKEPAERLPEYTRFSHSADRGVAHFCPSCAEKLGQRVIEYIDQLHDDIIHDRVTLQDAAARLRQILDVEPLSGE